MLTRPTVTNTHLEDTNKVLFVDSEEVTVVFSQDDGGGTRRIVQQSQLPKVLPLVQRGYQPLQMGFNERRSSGLSPLLTATAEPTFPCVITFTEPFQMMYQEVPLSP